MSKDIRLLYELMKSFWNWVVMTVLTVINTAKHWTEYFTMAERAMLTSKLAEILKVFIDMPFLESSWKHLRFSDKTTRLNYQLYQLTLLVKLSKEHEDDVGTGGHINEDSSPRKEGHCLCSSQGISHR